MRNILYGILIYLSALCFATIREACAEDYSAWLKACAPYREAVERVLLQENADIFYFYLMVAESRCTEGALSDKGALGFWQLMPATARYYGCDRPHDLTCATKAAARYLKHLEEDFETIEGIIAAYNMGGHNLKRRGRTSQAKGLVDRVFSLYRSDNEYPAQQL